jgi:outer membrane protein TolC
VEPLQPPRVSADAAPLPEPLPPPAPRASGDAPSGVLTLDDVVHSVLAGFPLLQAELAERQVADGRSISAWGPYDLNIEMYGIAAPLGYYKNYRSGVGWKQACYRGGYLYGGYRNGSGDIQPWYKERLTNEGGEFKLGVGVPLLQGRQIDKYRAEVMASELARAAVEPGIQSELLQFILGASDAYWSWVAAGKMETAQRQLLRLATARVQQIEERVRSGDLERIAAIDNQRLIASRETKQIEAQRKLQAAAIKLSLFLRDERGEPLVAESRQLPTDFPSLRPYNDDQLTHDIEQARAIRPELQYLDLQVDQIRIELAAAENLLQPKVDARLEASKDVGAPVDTNPDDKSPFELEAGIWGELPLQRRQACGKVQSLQGKLAQLAAKRQFSADKVAMEVRDAVSALQAAEGRIDRARTTVGLARQSLDLGRQAFESGDLTVVTLNLYEQAVLDAELQRIEAEADYCRAWAAYQAALGVTPFSPDYSSAAGR